MGTYLSFRCGAEKRLITRIIVMPPACLNNRCCWRSRYIGPIRARPSGWRRNFAIRPAESGSRIRQAAAPMRIILARDAWTWLNQPLRWSHGPTVDYLMEKLSGEAGEWSWRPRTPISRVSQPSSSYPMTLPVVPRLSLAFRREAQACRVFLNRLVIAGHAIAAVSKAADQKGRIRIRTSLEGGTVHLRCRHRLWHPRKHSRPSL
jgi:hypothetical protein